MYSLNRAELIGNLTKDPEVKQFQSGSTMAQFSIATNYTYKDQSGEKHDKPEYHNIVVFGKLVDIVSKYLHKGNKVFIDGRLQTRSWEAKDGSKRYSTEIILQSLIILTPKGDNAGPAYRGEQEGEYMGDTGRGTETRPPEDASDIELEDLPF